MSYTKKTAPKKRLPVKLIIIALLLLLSGAAVYKLQNKPSSTNQISNNPAQAEEEKIDLSPATEEDRARVDQHKENLPAADEQKTNSSNQKSVTPIIVDAGHYDSSIEVRSYIPGTVESNGKCQILFTKDSSRVVKEVVSTPDATTTRCTNLKVARSEFASSGTWTVVVNYSSPTSNGSSDNRTFEVN